MKVGEGLAHLKTPQTLTSGGAGVALQSHVGTLRSSVEGCGLFVLNVTKLRTSPATFFNSLGDIWVRGRVCGGEQGGLTELSENGVATREA